jgi:hypothetical protein
LEKPEVVAAQTPLHHLDAGRVPDPLELRTGNDGAIDSKATLLAEWHGEAEAGVVGDEIRERKVEHKKLLRRKWVPTKYLRLPTCKASLSCYGVCLCIVGANIQAHEWLEEVHYKLFVIGASYSFMPTSS